jgi:signal peptidase I
MLNYLKYLLGALIVCGSLIAAGWLIAWLMWGASFYSVQSGSMVPTLHRGDLVVSVRPGSLSVGDVVSYPSASIPGQLVTHRVAAISRGYVTTKGDNLLTADPPVVAAAIKGKSVAAIPWAGYVFDRLRTPLGLALIVYLPALAVVVGELWLVTGHFKYRPYQLI